MTRPFALGAVIALTLSYTLVPRSFSPVADAAAQASSMPGMSQQGQSGPSMQDMMKMHEQMMAEMKAGDSKLDALLAEMNAARGDAKVNAVAAAVTELVRQHKAMHAHMAQMHEQMMGGRGMMQMK